MIEQLGKMDKCNTCNWQDIYTKQCYKAPECSYTKKPEVIKEPELKKSRLEIILENIYNSKSQPVVSQSDKDYLRNFVIKYNNLIEGLKNLPKRNQVCFTCDGIGYIKNNICKNCDMGIVETYSIEDIQNLIKGVEE